jgi:hypothetical protein
MARSYDRKMTGKKLLSSSEISMAGFFYILYSIFYIVVNRRYDRNDRNDRKNRHL